MIALNDGGDSSGGNVSAGEQQMKLCLTTSHLLLCGPIPNRPHTWGLGIPALKGTICTNAIMLWGVRKPYLSQTQTVLQGILPNL